MTIRVLLVDDHQLMREGLHAILDRDPDLEVVGEAGGGREAIRTARSVQPDVVLMDLVLGDLNGIDATRRISRDVPSAKVIALSTYAGRKWVIAALEAGASGYVLKACAFEELRRAVHDVHAGRPYLCSQVAGTVVDAVAGGRGHSVFSLLAPREREVLQRVAEGMSSGEIAQDLHLSPHTVETHRRNLMRKLDLHNVAELTRYAIAEGLTTVE